MYELLRGSGVIVAFFLFLLGMAFQIIRFLIISKKIKLNTTYPDTRPSYPKGQEPVLTFRYRLIKAFAGFQQSAFGRNPVMAPVSFFFHLSLFVAPLFLVGHNILLDESWRISLFSLPERVCDAMTVVFMACGFFFLMRRIFLAKVRVLTTGADYLMLTIALTPFVTGFLAYHQLVDYQKVMMLHMLSGELMIIAIPFTKISHMLFFFINRKALNTENSFKRGAREW